MIGSFAVICGHLGNGVNLFYDWFPPYSFHLPLFLFSSGYFYKNDSIKNVRGYVFHKIKTLLIPLYLWNLLYAVITLLSHKMGFSIGWQVNIRSLFWIPFYNGHQFDYNCPSWFVAPLFLVQMFNVVFRKLLNAIGIRENELAIAIVYFIFAYVSYDFLQITLLGELSLPLSHMFTMLPYYSVGTLYKKYERKESNNYYSFIIIAFVGSLFIKHITGSNLTYNIVLFSIQRQEYYWLSYVQSFLGIAFWVSVANILLPVIQGKKWIKSISDSAFSIMVNQLAVGMVIKGFFALAYKYTSFCSGFNMTKFYSEVYYVYLPRDNMQWQLFYDMAALLVPVFIQKMVNNCKCLIIQKVAIAGTSH